MLSVYPPKTAREKVSRKLESVVTIRPFVGNGNMNVFGRTGV